MLRPVPELELDLEISYIIIITFKVIIIIIIIIIIIYIITSSDYFGNHRRSQQMHDKLFCCAMQKTKPSVSLRKLCSAAVCCNAVCCNKLRSATPQERDAFSQVVHRLEQTMQHCFVQQSSYKRDAAGTRHLLTRRSTRDLEFVWVIARRLKL